MGVFHDKGLMGGAVPLAVLERILQMPASKQ
jgi:uncharacterized protein (DUF885 family)